MNRDNASDPGGSPADAGDRASQATGEVRDVPVVAQNVRWERPTVRAFWNALADPEREALAAAGVEEVFRAGSVLYRAGDDSSQVMIIDAGWVKVSVRDASGEKILAVRGQGDLVGERAALTTQVRSATVTALDEVAAMVVPADRFAEFLRGHPRAAEVLQRQVQERQEEDRTRLFQGERAGAERRLARLLLDLAQRRGGYRHGAAAAFTLPMSQQELADWAGTTADAVGRFLRSWRERGIIVRGERSRRLTVVDLDGLAAICDGAQPAAPDATGSLEITAEAAPEVASRWFGVPAEPLNCSILFTDVAGFGNPLRLDPDREVVRAALYEILRSSLEASGVPWAGCYYEDRGDGAVIVVPPTISTLRMVDPLIPELAERLRQYNRRASEVVQIQLRAALHVGPVGKDAKGLIGQAVIGAARIIDAPVIKDRLAEARADLIFAVSDYVYEHVVRHGAGRVDSGAFEHVAVQVKDSRVSAWIHVVGRIEPAPSPVGVARPEPVAPPLGNLPADVRGRDALLGELRRALQPYPRRASRTFVIAGMGGLGKSTVALAAAKMAKDRGYRVWWLDATDTALLTSGMLEVLRELQAPESVIAPVREGARTAPSRAWEFLNGEHAGGRRWLLIFDGADDPAVLAGAGATPPADGTGWLRADPAGMVIVTTRNEDPQVLGTAVTLRKLKPLDDETSAEVLRDLAPEVTDPGGYQARELSRRLGGLPLALHLAGAYLGSPYARWSTFADYHQALDAVALADIEVPGTDMRSTAAELLVGFEQSGDTAMLDQAILALRRALEAKPPGDPTRALDLANLGVALRLLAERTGDAVALSDAVEALRTAVSAAPSGDPARYLYMANLGVALLARFGEFGQVEDLAEAATISRRAASSTNMHRSYWITIVSRAEALRQQVDCPYLASEYLLWAVYQGAGSVAQELIGTAMSTANAQAALANLVHLDTHLTSTDTDVDFAELRFSPSAQRALAATTGAAGFRSVIGEREFLAGLLRVPQSKAAGWLAEVCELSAGRLYEIVIESANSPAGVLAERVRAARRAVTYGLRFGSADDQVELGGVLEVYAQLAPAAPDGDDYLLNASVGDTELTILLQAPGFLIQDEDAAVLSMEPRGGDRAWMLAQPARFRLTALRPGRTTITATVFRGSIFETVLEQVVTISEEQPSIQIERRGAVRPRPVPLADLTLEVRTEWQPSLSSCVLVYWLTSSLLPRSLGDGSEFRSERLLPGWLGRMRGLLAATIAETVDTSTGDAYGRLRSFGQYLAELLMPEELRSELARLGEARTLQLVADEDAWAPWELVHDGTAFLGERFVIGRWPRELDGVRPYEIPLGPVSIAYYQGIEHVEQWAALVQPFNAPPAVILPDGVLGDVAETESPHGLHLVRRTQPDDLGRRDAPVPANGSGGDDLRKTSLAVHRERPVVSISYVRNGSVALAALEQTWAIAFLRARCSALVGPQWAVDEAIDAAFMAQFYERLWAGTSLGSAFRAAQIAAYAVRPGSLDWRAYVLFGDPMSRPYRPIKGHGYAVVERVGADLDAALFPGETARFRASLRRTPPIWHEDRLLEVVSEFALEEPELHVLTFGRAPALPAAPAN